jgi:hypothetical protein
VTKNSLLTEIFHGNVAQIPVEKHKIPKKSGIFDKTRAKSFYREPYNYPSQRGCNAVKFCAGLKLFCLRNKTEQRRFMDSQ